MNIIFDRIIAKLEDLSEYDDYGKLVDLDEAINVVYEIANEYKDKIVSIGAYEQVMWERDIAISQLEELGLGLGEEIDGFYLTQKEYAKLHEYKLIYEDLCK